MSDSQRISGMINSKASLSVGNQIIWNEKWTKIEMPGIENPPRYEVSNFGRLKSFQSDPEGSFIKGSVIQGYKSLNVKLPKSISFNRYFHKLIAEAFINKPSDDHRFVIHLDFDKQNNRYDNLRWVTKDEMVEHNRTNPAVLNKAVPKRTSNYKLTETKVKMIKKMLKSEKNRLKMIAKQFGITPTQLGRIKNGENWAHVVID